MSTSLANLIRDIVGHAGGMPEPQYDSMMEAANWPLEFRQRLRACVSAISRETDSAELASAARELERLPHDVPDAISTILARALYDNESTPMNLS